MAGYAAGDGESRICVVIEAVGSVKLVGRETLRPCVVTWQAGRRDELSECPIEGR